MNRDNLPQQPTECASLWIGERLGPIERACLRSVMRQGHPLSLYVYGAVEGVPEGVTVRDASAVVPEEQIIRHRRGSLALFSDLFRFELLRRGLGTWIDCDMYLVAQLDGSSSYLFGHEGERFVNTGVLRIPADSPILAPLLSVFEGRVVPFWLPLTARLAARLRLWRDGNTDVTRMPWGSAGPKALTAMVHSHGLQEHVQPPEVFCPVSYRAADWIRDPRRQLEDVIKPRTVAVHLWNECIRGFTEQPAASGSFLARLQSEGS